MSVFISAQAEVTAEDLVEAGNDEQLFQLIVGIDDYVADWDFTLRLYEHFAQQKAKHDETEVEYAKRGAP